MTADQRSRRDARVFKLFLAGLSYREIAPAVGVKSPTTVGRIVKRELGREDARRELVAGAAVLTERTETLFRAHWPAALRGEYRSSVICLRILEQQQRVHAVAQGIAVRRDDEDDVGDEDDLARWRRERRA